MDLFITSDANAESGVGKVIDQISGPTGQHFAKRNYGFGLLGIGVVLMCRNPELNFKRRLRFTKAEKRISMDIMLNLEQMRSADHENRKQMVFDRLIEEVPAVLCKYSIPDFDESQFVQDLKTWFDKISVSDQRK